MGGKAAKERRRLERLSKQNGNFTKKITQPNKQTTKKEKDVSSQQPKSFRPGNHIKKNPPHHGPKKQSKHHVKKPMMKKSVSKKNVSKKPKHLKRKLEQATSESIKKQLEEEINQLKTRKELFSLQNKTEKPQKKLRISKAESSKEGSVGASTAKQTCKSEGERDSHQKTNEATNNPPRVHTEEKGEKIKLTARDQDVEIFKPTPTKESRDYAKSLLKQQNQTPITNGTLHETKGDIHSNSSPSIKRLSLTHDSDSGDSSSSDDDIEEPVKRQRGRRRRGRKDTEQRIKEMEIKKILEDVPQRIQDGAKEKLNIDKPELDGDKRRCIGRKPVTDFKVGEKYPGEVVYIKPYGVFIDIMCHSEAFCHVSRVQDGFIKSPDEVLSIEDKVVARVVEIDRKLKRITVSLQTDERITDELASAEAHKTRLSKREQKKDKRSLNASYQKSVDDTVEISPSTPEESNTNNLVDAEGNYLKSESEMTPAELKRARKLARRAQRRAQKEDTGLSA